AQRSANTSSRVMCSPTRRHSSTPGACASLRRYPSPGPTRSTVGRSGRWRKLIWRWCRASTAARAGVPPAIGRDREAHMRAAVIYQHGGPGSIALATDFPDPSPGPGDVVVRIRATSLNYHDIFTRRGMPGIKVPMPCIMGLDFAGDIVEVGADVEGFARGDRVLIDPVDRVGPGGLIGEMWHGGLAELARVPAHHLVRLPDDVGYEAAACLPVAYGTALRMMYTIGQVKAGDKVLILGASGGVGTCCVQLAKNAGCEVIACASSPDK